MVGRYIELLVSIKNAQSIFYTNPENEAIIFLRRSPYIKGPLTYLPRIVVLFFKIAVALEANLKVDPSILRNQYRDRKK